MLIDSYRSMIVRFASRVTRGFLSPLLCLSLDILFAGERKPLGPGYTRSRLLPAPDLSFSLFSRFLGLIGTLAGLLQTTEPDLGELVQDLFSVLSAMNHQCYSCCAAVIISSVPRARVPNVSTPFSHLQRRSAISSLLAVICDNFENQKALLATPRLQVR